MKVLIGSNKINKNKIIDVPENYSDEQIKLLFPKELETLYNDSCYIERKTDISLTDLFNLLIQSATLSSLVASKVDTWDGYNDAQKNFLEKYNAKTFNEMILRDMAKILGGK